LLGFLGHDPDNLRLIGDAAEAALGERQLDLALQLLDRHAALSALPPSLMNLKGLVALEEGRIADAAEIFELLLADHASDGALRLNLAWCRAMQNDWARVSELLDGDAASTTAQAARLKIQALHHLGRLGEALNLGEQLHHRFAEQTDLTGLLAAVAVDAEQLTVAEQYALQAGDQSDALAALGMVCLDAGGVDRSLPYFERALALSPSDGRALLGKGLALLSKGDAAAGCGLIDRAAEQFATHLGTWVAAGWAHLVRGDLVTSRARFEKALAIDDTFAEIHGGLAVLDVMEGQLESAQRRTEVALRLDRNCFSAALAKTLLLMARGKERSAERVRNLALSTPIGTSGRTLAQAMARLAKGVGKPADR
jgi:tetratricopeptide (TPR) repeat protein